MKKVYLNYGQVVTDCDELTRLRLKARAHDDYLRAINYMTGYMYRTKAMRDEPRVDDITRARMNGRIEAITTFDRAVVRYASLRDMEEPRSK